MGNKMESKTNIAWTSLFNDYSILNEINKNGTYEITTDAIKEYREPRLMAKFDSEDALPEIFRENDINILPLSYSSYVIGRFKLFKKFPKKNYKKPIPISLMDFQTLKPESITSEANAINVLVLSKALDDFLNTKENYGTFNGRMGSGPFNYFVNTTTSREYIESQTVQLEIDGGFENADSVVIMEAKNVIHDDFNIRQLYFPYRLWRKQVTKPIRLVFSIYNNFIYRLLEYRFADDEDLNSIELVKEAYYTLENIYVGLDELHSVISYTYPIYRDDGSDSIKIVFPQANSVERFISLLELIKQSPIPLTAEEIAEELEFDIRQSDYYYNMGSYLQMLEKRPTDKGIAVFITKEGVDFLKLNFRGRLFKLVESLCKHAIWKELLYRMVDPQNVINNNNKPYIETNDEIAELLLNHHIVPANSTATRRASSIRAWLHWIASCVE